MVSLKDVNKPELDDFFGPDGEASPAIFNSCMIMNKKLFVGLLGKSSPARSLNRWVVNICDNSADKCIYYAEWLSLRDELIFRVWNPASAPELNTTQYKTKVDGPKR